MSEKIKIYEIQSNIYKKFHIKDTSKISSRMKWNRLGEMDLLLWSLNRLD